MEPWQVVVAVPWAVVALVVVGGAVYGIVKRPFAKLTTGLGGLAQRDRRIGRRGARGA